MTHLLFRCICRSTLVFNKRVCAFPFNFVTLDHINKLWSLGFICEGSSDGKGNGRKAVALKANIRIFISLDKQRKLRNGFGIL